MSDERNPCISSRKQLRQTRSSGLMTSVLEATVQVLANEGAQRFTTAWVVEHVGVNTDLLYQYFPNKAAILFRLQSDEWQRAMRLLDEILKDIARPPLECLRRPVLVFVHSGCGGAAIRVALSDAAPLYRDTDEAQEVKAEDARVFQTFLREALPEVAETERGLADDLLTTTLGAVDKQFSEQLRSEAEIERYTEALADMFCVYLAALGERQGAVWSEQNRRLAQRSQVCGWRVRRLGGAGVY